MVENLGDILLPVLEPVLVPLVDEPVCGLYVEPTGAELGGTATLKGLFGAAASFGAVGCTLGLATGAFVGALAFGAFIGVGFLTGAVCTSVVCVLGCGLVTVFG